MANLRNINITITATDQTGSGISSALSNISKLNGGIGGIGSIAAGVFGGVLGAGVFTGIARGIGGVVSSAFTLNNRMAESQAAAQSMVNAMAESEPVAEGAFGAAAKAAQAFERTMREVREREADGNADYAEQVDKIKQSIIDAQNDIADKTSSRITKEKDQLADLKSSYDKTYKNITENIDDEMRSFQERMYDLENAKNDKIDNLTSNRADKEKKTAASIADATSDYADDIAKIEESLSDKLLTLNKQLADAKNRADIAYVQARIADANDDAEREKKAAADKRDTKIAGLNAELAAFITENDAEIKKVNERSAHEIAVVTETHNIKLARLKEELAAEKIEYDKKKADIEKDTADDIASYKKAGDEKVANLQSQLKRQEEEHKRFLRDIKEAYDDAQVKLDQGAGGGTAGQRTVKFNFDFADAFRDMSASGIDQYLKDVQEKYVSIGVKSPFNIGDIQNAGKALVGYTGGSSDNMEHILNITQALAARNPMQGMLGATTSMVELFGSGNITSLARRFDIPKASLEGLSKAKDETEFINLLDNALSRSGITMGLVEAKTQTAGGAFENLKETFNLVAAEVTKPIWDILTEKLVALNEWLFTNKDTIKSWSDTLGTIVGTVVTPLIDGFVNFGIILSQFWETNGKQIMDWFNNMSGVVFPVFQSALQLLQTIWTETIQPAIEKVVIPSLQRIYDKLAILWKEIAPAIKETLDFINKWWKENSDQIMQTVQVIWAVIEFVITTAMDIVSGVIRVALAVIRGDWGAAWEAIKDTFVGVWNNMKQLVSSVWEAIGGSVKNGINNVIDQINGFINGLNDKLGKTKVKVGSVEIGGWQLPTIPKLATGGIVTSPTVAMIGEAGPEAIVPLSGQNRGGGGLGNNISVYVTGNTILNDRDADRLADVVGESLTRKLALQGNYLYK